MQQWHLNNNPFEPVEGEEEKKIFYYHYYYYYYYLKGIESPVEWCEALTHWRRRKATVFNPPAAAVTPFKGCPWVLIIHLTLVQFSQMERKKNRTLMKALPCLITTGGQIIFCAVCSAVRRHQQAVVCLSLD